MLRSQLYLITLFILFFFISTFSNYLSLIEETAQEYRDYFNNLLVIYKAKNFHTIYQKLYVLQNSTVYGLTVYYNCSSTNVSIRNPGFSSVIVVDENLNFIETASDQNWINFTIYERIVYNPAQNICIFKGYLVVSKKYNIASSIIGTQAILSILHNLSIQNISKEFLLLANKIERDFNIRILNNTIEYSNNYFRINLP